MFRGREGDLLTPSRETTPIAAYLNALLLWTTKGDTVLDLNANSANCARACMVLGRNYVGLNPSSEKVAAIEGCMIEFQDHLRANFVSAMTEWVRFHRLGRGQVADTHRHASVGIDEKHATSILVHFGGSRSKSSRQIRSKSVSKPSSASRDADMELAPAGGGPSAGVKRSLPGSPLDDKGTKSKRAKPPADVAKYLDMSAQEGSRKGSGREQEEDSEDSEEDDS